MIMKPFTMITIFVLVLVSVIHVLRLFLGWEVIISGVLIPMWASILGFILAGTLAFMVWYESR
jgi:hypothetical protein